MGERLAEIRSSHSAKTKATPPPGGGPPIDCEHLYPIDLTCGISTESEGGGQEGRRVTLFDDLARFLANVHS